MANSGGLLRESSQSWWRERGLRVGILGAFVLAGLTGTLYRMGLAYGWTLGLNLGDIRHAHSHLMYMGWATPALFLVIGIQVGRTDDRGVLYRVVTASLVLSLVAFLSFLFFGYRSIPLGSAELPPSVIVSGLNIVAWYVFAVWYWHQVRGSPVSPGRRLWDLAVVMLLLSTVGAWGLAALKPLGIESAAWTESLKHLFLDVASDGWLVPAVLGLALHEVRARPVSRVHWSLLCIGVGIPLSFFIGVPTGLVPATLRLISGAASILAAAGLAYHVRSAWGAAGGRSSIWRIPLAFLAVKLVAQVVVAVVPGVSWSDLQALRILYLHVLLLGFVTTGIAAEISGRRGGSAVALWRLLVGSVVLVIASLAALSIPALIVEPVVWRFAAWVSLGPTLVIGFIALLELGPWRGPPGIIAGSGSQP